jgi:hypothetical protein
MARIFLEVKEDSTATVSDTLEAHEKDLTVNLKYVEGLTVSVVFRGVNHAPRRTMTHVKTPLDYLKGYLGISSPEWLREAKAMLEFFDSKPPEEDEDNYPKWLERLGDIRSEDKGRLLEDWLSTQDLLDTWDEEEGSWEREPRLSIGGEEALRRLRCYKFDGEEHGTDLSQG